MESEVAVGPELFDLSGKVAVVTGGGRGIGLMMAEGLLRAGAKVYVSSRKITDLDAAVESLSPLGPVESIPADLGTAPGVTTLAAALGEREDAIHALFNNAGAAWGAPFNEFPESGFDKVFNVNVKGLFLLTRALVPMLTAGSTDDDPARVINIGSIDGLIPPAMETFSYSSSKAAVHHLTRHLARFLGPRHITANAIAPGYFPTVMTRWAKDREDELMEHVPLRRTGRPDDLAGTALFLASRAGAYCSGAVIRVDGGLLTDAREI